MGFIENSYTNSNNGGSVNSQDSLWQMKMAAANNAATLPAHQVLDRQSNYDYDPISHAGYRNIDDYAHYSHLPHASQPPAPNDYDMRAAQNPSRQEYCSDPYASVHKPKKRMDQHIGKHLFFNIICITILTHTIQTFSTWGKSFFSREKLTINYYYKFSWNVEAAR